MRSTARLGDPLKQMGSIALALLGIGLVLLVAGFYVVLGSYFAGALVTPSYPQGAYIFWSLLGAAFAFLLVAGIFAVWVGIEIGKGILPRRRALIAVVAFSLFLVLAGVLEVFTSSQTQIGTSSMSTSGILYIISGALLSVGFVLFSTRAVAGEVTGSILGVLAVILFMIGGADLGGTLKHLSGLYGLPELYQFGGGTSSLIGGISAGSFLVVGFLIAGIAAFMYSFLKNSRLAHTAKLIAALALVGVGPGELIPSLSYLFGPVWKLSGPLLAIQSLNILGAIFQSISAILITVLGALGVAYSAGQLRFPAGMVLASNQGGSGGVGTTGGAASGVQHDVVDRLLKLKSLMDSGAISRAEFEAEKGSLLYGKTEPIGLEGQLRNLKSLVDSGTITRQEFDEQKKKILDKL